jgi:hypothetical protein
MPRNEATRNRYAESAQAHAARKKHNARRTNVKGALAEFASLIIRASREPDFEKRHLQNAIERITIAICGPVQIAPKGDADAP